MKQSCARFIAYRGEYNLHSVQDTSYATSTTLMFSSHVNTFCNYTGQLNGEVLCSIPAKQKATPNSITGRYPCLHSESATIYYYASVHMRKPGHTVIWLYVFLSVCLSVTVISVPLMKFKS